MNLQDFIEEEYYVLVAPDFATCIAQVKMLHKCGMSESFHELVKVRGFEIIPVKVTIIQNGTAEEGYQAAKQKL